MKGDISDYRVLWYQVHYGQILIQGWKKSL